MKMFSLISLSSIFFFIIVDEAESQCINGFVSSTLDPYNCYYLTPQPRTTCDASILQCTNLRLTATLPTFNDINEYISYITFLRFVNTSSTDTHWIGLSDTLSSTSTGLVWNGSAFLNLSQWIGTQNVSVNYAINSGGLCMDAWKAANSNTSNKFSCQLRLKNTTTNCPSKWYYDPNYANICYMNLQLKYTWINAFQYCSNLTTYPTPTLPILLTDIEFNGFHNFSSSKFPSSPVNYYWIGMKALTSSSMIWMDGSPITTSHWYSSFSASYNCCLSWIAIGSKWYPYTCTYTCFTICQMRMTSVVQTPIAINNVSTSIGCYTSTVTSTSTIPTTSTSQVASTTSSTSTVISSSSTKLTTSTTTESATTSTTTKPTSMSTATKSATPLASTIQVTSTSTSSSTSSSTTTSKLVSTTSSKAIATSSTQFINLASTPNQTLSLSTALSVLTTKLIYTSVAKNLSSTSTSIIKYLTSTFPLTSSSSILTSTSSAKRLFDSSSSTAQNTSSSLTAAVFSLSSVINVSGTTSSTSVSPSTKIYKASTTQPIPNVLKSSGLDQSDLNDPASVAAAIQTIGPLIMATLNDSVKRQIGQDLSDLLRVCSYDAISCYNESNFAYMYDPTYGNCYSFNTGLVSKYQVVNVGANHGIRVMMGSSQQDYSCSSMEAGFRVVFHQNNMPAYPDSEGYSISPGTVTYISLTQTVVKRSNAHGRPCAGDIFGDFVKNYTVESCIRYCIQKALIDSCKCASPFYPMLPNAVYCGVDQKSCMDYVVSCTDDVLPNCNCPPACNEIIYEPTITAARMISTDYRNQLCETNSNVTNCMLTFNTNFALVYIFYETLKSTFLTEVPAYGLQNMLSDFAGESGILLGVCVISVIEFGFLIMMIMHKVFVAHFG